MTVFKAEGKGSDGKKGTSPFLPAQEKTSPQPTFHRTSQTSMGPRPSVDQSLTKANRNLTITFNLKTQSGFND